MENPPEGSPPSGEKAPQRQRISGSTLLLLALVAIAVIFFLSKSGAVSRSEIPYGVFRQELGQGNIASANAKGMKIYGEFKNPPPVPEGKTGRDGSPERYDAKFFTVVPPQVLDSPALDEILLKSLGPNYSAAEPSDSTGYM